jgi:hypothetical protein
MTLGDLDSSHMIDRMFVACCSYLLIHTKRNGHNIWQMRRMLNVSLDGRNLWRCPRYQILADCIGAAKLVAESRL